MKPNDDDPLVKQRALAIIAYLPKLADSDPQQRGIAKVIAGATCDINAPVSERTVLDIHSHALERKGPR